jgi:hypothetical protein
MRTLAFYRDFQAFSGGHLKVWDYFCHTLASHSFTPTIYFTATSQMNLSNPWVAAGEQIQSRWEPHKADALFLGGLDWLAVPEDCATPVVNLVQGVRHANPADPRYKFLQRRAFRICVSKEVELAIMATGKVNGPVITIPAGLDIDRLPQPSRQRDIALLIAGLKQPTLARKLSDELAERGIATTSLTNPLPRPEFLGLLGRAQITVFLPYEKEGFYLPALEGMAMGSLVVCPDCVGNRQFCFHEENCLRPDYNMASISFSCQEALRRIATASAMEIVAKGLQQAQAHSLTRERCLLLEVFNSVIQGLHPNNLKYSNAAMH